MTGRDGRPARRASRLLGALTSVVVLLALGACSGRASEWPEQPGAIAGGGDDGVYFAYGAALAGALEDAVDVPIEAMETAGSVDNLLRVDAGQALVGFAQGDAAADAVRGAGAFDEPLEVQAIARLYDEYLHVVVRADSDIDGIDDLAGRTVSLGAENSGVHVIAERVLEVAGVDPASVIDPQLDLAASIRAMQASEIEGFFWVGGIPTPGISELAASSSVRLLPVEQEWVTDVNRRFSDAYRPADLPVGLYGLAESEPTMAVPNYLVASSDTPDEVVDDVLDVLFESRTRLAQQVPAAALLDRRQAIFTGQVDLHTGAVEYYRDHRG